MPAQVYRFRVLGMGLSYLMIGTVLHQRGAEWPAWVWATVGCLVWPHVAYALARRSADGYRAERRSLLADSFIAGTMLPLMHFNVLPSVVLMTVVTADKLNVGVGQIWLRSLLLAGAGIALSALVIGVALAPTTSMIVLAASLPLMVIHTLAVSTNTSRLIRKVQMQNKRLDQLNREDWLTGLQSRAEWQERAQEMAEQPGPSTASLVVVDVDRFKAINDEHGHNIGDDVLRAIAGAILERLPAKAHAGRLGGDEFVVLLPYTGPKAQQWAESLRVAIESLAFVGAPALTASVSLGVADRPAAGISLRAWTEAADRALYLAKAEGRNRLSRVSA